jgi:hypothetical protein
MGSRGVLYVIVGGTVLAKCCLGHPSPTKRSSRSRARSAAGVGCAGDQHRGRTASDVSHAPMKMEQFVYLLLSVLVLV